MCVCERVCVHVAASRRLQISSADIRAEKLEAPFNTCLHKGVISEAAAAKKKKTGREEEEMGKK